MSDNPNSDADVVRRDSQVLGRAMSEVMLRNNQDNAATALFNEFQQIAGRGDDHVRRVFSEVQNNIGRHNFFSPGAVARQDSLCLTPGYMHSVAEAAVLPQLRLVCAYTNGNVVTNDGQSMRVQLRRRA